MADIDPGLAIVATVAVVVATFGVVALSRSRATRARIVALRTARTIEIPVVSSGRAAGIACALAAPLVFGAPIVAMALGSWGRDHALEFTIIVIVLAMLAVVAPLTYAARWTHVGRLVLEADALRIEDAAAPARIALDHPFDLREGIVPPGQHVETVVAVSQGDASITFRYPVLWGESPLAPEGAISSPLGVSIGAEGRVVHERLRERLTART